jgi:diguanylate cyclase (GGDEF)-like protein
MGEGPRSWLCPTELDRSRAVDANERVRNIRLVGVGCIGVALLAAAPWVGWWVLIPFGLTGINLITVERRLVRSAHPERVSAWAMVTTLGMLALGVALTGGPHSPALPWMVLPAGISATRFRSQVVMTGLGITVLAMLLATVGTHPRATVDDPVPVIATFALLGGVISIVSALQAAELHHRGEAILDPLTGLLNRHALVPRFIELSHQARLTGQPVCLILCDVDGFKKVNDVHGHDRGDAVLRDIAYELRKRLRSFELIYRLGGEEFLILLPGIGRKAGAEMAERLRSAVEQARPTGLLTTLSFGLSARTGEEVDYDRLFKDADQALYHAKRLGRNRVVSAPTSASEAQAETGAESAQAEPEAESLAAAHTPLAPLPIC